MSSRYLVFVLALLVSPVSSQTTPKRPAWPSVQPLRRAYSFRDASTARLSLRIKDIGGHPRYVLRCANTDLEYDWAEVMPGDFACWMRSINQKSGVLSTLDLLYTQKHDDFCRECVWVSNLFGNCPDYPDWGRERVFRLRGMKITISFENVKISPENDESVATFKSFDLVLSVRRDEGATSPVAAPSPFEAPSSFEAPPDEDHPCDAPKRALK